MGQVFPAGDDTPQLRCSWRKQALISSDATTTLHSYALQVHEPKRMGTTDSENKKNDIQNKEVGTFYVVQLLGFVTWLFIMQQICVFPLPTVSFTDTVTSFSNLVMAEASSVSADPWPRFQSSRLHLLFGEVEESPGATRPKPGSSGGHLE
ncbi:hypothetical protein F2P81_000500 [Scophthalmus maximus]|uniref:Uncharacterized protein n=1 Tax=Scophthalmus maximus TaxID=52904 RepID=A0A6A4TJA5_SCOMX|nr:hypothetical protein F2P81_000500 [Scophthalmus maximus]